MLYKMHLFAVCFACSIAVFTQIAGAVPSQLAISPPGYGSGAGGTAVTIQARGLDTTGVTRVLFGDADATNVQVSALGAGEYSIACKSPSHWGGLCNVTVINPDLSSAMLADAYVFVPTSFDPAVSGALPCFSPTSGGKTVFALGQEAGLPFMAYTLTVGGATITGVKEYTVPGCIPLYSGVSPSHAAGLAGLGVQGYGELIPNCFIYSDSTGPVILSCNPVHDWDVGGAQVHIIAGNLSLTGKPTVTFGGVAAADVVVHPDFGGYLTCTAPPHAAGLVDIVVTNPDTQSGTLPGAFNYDSTYTPAPLSVTPNQGPGYLSNWVTISGTGFSPIGTTQVMFGEAQASGVFAGGDTTLTCYTPLHAAGTVDVVVTNPGGAVGTLANGYTFLPAITPVPTAISPATGQEAGGTRVMITGTGFMPGGTTQVSFGGVQLYTVQVEDAGDGSFRIVCQTPSHAPGVVDVVVTNPGDLTGTLVGGFAYMPQRPPAPAVVTPKEGTTLGGTQLTITGTGFTPYQPMRVTIDGVDATGLWVDDDSTLTCTTPAHSAGVVDVAVIAFDDSTGVLPGGFVYVEAPPPTVNAVTPNEGPATGGMMVTLAGAGFSSLYSNPVSTKVLFGGVEAANVNVVSDVCIQCYTPEHPSEVVDVAVVNPDGKTGTLSGGFTYVEVPPPSVVSLSPTHGLVIGGTTVTISGAGFCSLPGATSRVLFGGVEATDINVGGSNSISCKTPPHAAGSVDVVVVNPDGKTGALPNGYSYLNMMLPIITSIYFPMGYAVGGSYATIYGSNFSESGATRVSFGDVESPDVYVGNSGGNNLYIRCQIPPHAPGGVDITVYNPGGGTATLHNGFTYILGPPPGLDKIVPAEGLVGGGTPVLLSGSQYGKLGTTRVVFGGADATEVEVLSDSSIFCISPPHAAGTAEVVVVNSDGQTATLPDAFNYRGPASAIVRVDVDNRSGNEDGARWETAFTSVQAGIDAVKATGEPGEVWVAEGTYTTAGNTVVAMAPFCDLYGGFAGNETLRDQRDTKAHDAVIDGEGVHACVYGADNARLDGFTITRGNGPARSGVSGTLAALISSIGSYSDIDHLLAIDNAGVSPTFADCLISGNGSSCAVMVNMADFEKPSNPLIIGCSFSDNGVSSYAVLNGDVNGTVSRVRMTDCSFARNFIGVVNLGSGAGCSPTISRCVFSANKNAGLMALSITGSCRPRLENCLFTAHTRGVLNVMSPYSASAGLDLDNCTIAGNPTRRDVIDAPIFAGAVRLANCIVWDNGGVLATQNSPAKASYCDVQGGYPGTGNLDADPLFVNPAAGNFQLQTASPCADTGTADGAPTVDLLGAPRPQRAGMDMGAYEVPNPVPAPDVVGQTQDAAAEVLAGAGFAVGTVRQGYNLAVPVGTVLSQRPVGGALVQPGSAIDLVLSRGGIAVPDVVGKQQPAAEAVITNAILIVGTVTQQYSATVPVGVVVAQTPTAGASVLPSAAVDLVVSRGVQPSVMPDVLGEPQTQAETAVTAAGLALGPITQDFNNTVAAGNVIAQSPAAGTELPQGTAVSIVVSLGPPSAVEPVEGEGEPADTGKLRQQLAAAYASADVNGDGRLSLEEALSAVTELTRNTFEALDTNADGQLTPDELGADTGTGCRGTKGAVGPSDWGRQMGDLFLLALGSMGLAVMFTHRRP